MPSVWNSLLVNLHETLNESGWIDLVHDATKGEKNDGRWSDIPETSSETAREGTKNFDQIYKYIQEVAKSKSEPSHLRVYFIHTPRRGYGPKYPPRNSQGHRGDTSCYHGIDICLQFVCIYRKTYRFGSHSLNPAT
jgi:hypothetical protein